MNIEIVEYSHPYAAGVADMWNKSADSWGGGSAVTTEEQVRREEDTFVHVNCYLALADGLVVGYCKMGEWTKDEGALYVDGLNVRPDYHGKKIGKALMLKAVERTIELGWPRLDLHTWGGNTKAVPLYKKIGFFWEERDLEVYLVNFIPGVLKNELVKGFFNHADWYQDSTREIQIEPDGRKENDFTYFTYSWCIDDQSLEVEYERHGRGLRRINNNSFEISATVEGQKLVFGRSYRVCFDVRNKTDTPIAVDIRGFDDKNIAFDFAYSGKVTGLKRIEAEFFVKKVEIEQSEWKTHPRVCADISVDGRAAPFMVGIEPMFPAKISLIKQSGVLMNAKKYRAHIDIESNLAESSSFAVSLPDVDGVAFAQQQVCASLQPHQRTSIPVEYSVSKSCVYNGWANARALLASGEKIEFRREIGVHFNLATSPFYGELIGGGNYRAYTAGMGRYRSELVTQRDTHINFLKLQDDLVGRDYIRFFTPKLGKPYTEEFIRKKPDNIKGEAAADGVVTKAMYTSDDFPGVTFSMCWRIAGSGMFHRWFVISNASDQPTDRSIFLQDNFRGWTEGLAVPYHGKILLHDTGAVSGPDYFETDGQTENWTYSSDEKGSVAIIWDPSLLLQFNDWTNGFEYEVGVLRPGETATLPTLMVALNMFSHWKQCRDFVLSSQTPTAVDSLETVVNGGNPFVGDTYSVNIIEHRKMPLWGSVSISSEMGEIDSEQKDAKKEDNCREIHLHAAPKSQLAIDVVSVNLNLSVHKSVQRHAVFQTEAELQVETDIKKTGEHDVIEIKNGRLVLRASPTFAPVLFSCTFEGNEWLDSTFPHLGPRDWWNPWTGGIGFYPPGMEAQAVLKEKRWAEVATVQDTLGNRWTGIKMSVSFAEHRDFKGLEYDHYFMLIPGSPVLMSQVVISQQTGTHIEGKEMGCELFLMAADDHTKAKLHFRDRRDRPGVITSGHEERWFSVPGCFSLRSSDRSERVYLFSDKTYVNAYAVTNKKTTLLTVGEQVTCAHGNRMPLRPSFLIFSRHDLDEEALSDLRNISLFQYP